jgi:hypothetical protein
MKRDFLEGLLTAIEDEASRKDLIDKIMDEHGKSVNTSKSKIDELTEQLGLKTKEAEEASTLIADLKKTNQGNEDLQAKIGGYGKTIEDLQAENEKLKLESALKLELLANKAVPEDIDYLMYRLQNDSDKELKIDENGKLVGFDEVLDGLKVSYPNNFEKASKKEVDELLLPKGDDKKSTLTKEQFDKMGYKEKMELYNNDPETYNQLKK